jgi:hypothetical protein
MGFFYPDERYGCRHGAPHLTWSVSRGPDRPEGPTGMVPGDAASGGSLRRSGCSISSRDRCTGREANHIWRSVFRLTRRTDGALRPAFILGWGLLRSAAGASPRDVRGCIAAATHMVGSPCRNGFAKRRGVCDAGSTTGANTSGVSDHISCRPRLGGMSSRRSVAGSAWVGSVRSTL